ncbi:Synaptotagmin-11 [Halotydeus destructor]|nr:Synaptotagmin-11 [Halotydeus destructor]
MVTTTELIVIISLCSTIVAFAGLLLYLKIRKSTKKTQEDYDFFRDKVLLFPGDKGTKSPSSNRMYQIIDYQRRISQSSVESNGSLYPPPSDVTAAGLFVQGEFLRVPALPMGYISDTGSEASSIAKSSNDSFGDSASGGEAKSSRIQESSDVKHSAEDVELPSIEFNINYFSSTQSLNVTIIKIKNIPSMFRKHCSSYVKISLKAFNKLKTKRFKTKTIRNSLNPFYDEEISFQGYDFDELKNFRIRLSCYAKSRKLAKKQLVGDLYVPLARPDLEPDVLLGCYERLSLACPETGKRGEYVLAGELGYLQVELSYQADVKRLKVVIRKGQQLPAKADTRLGSAEYYIIVSLLKDNVAILYKETRPSLGTNPTWNQPFLFYLDEGHENDYCLQFVIMKGKTFGTDGPIGQVVIGHAATVTGHAHWNQAVDNESAEDVVKWHEIIPSKTTCSGPFHK